jgi:anti-anti-sigma factor
MTTETSEANPLFRGMPLVTTRVEGEVAIVTIQVESLDDPDASRIASACIELAGPDRGGYVRQAVSLGLVREVTCAGLRSLVQASESLSAAGGRLILFGAPQDVRQIIRRTGLRLTVAHGAKEAVRLASDEPARFRLFGRSSAA